MSINWKDITTRNGAEHAALDVLRTFGFSGGAFSYTPMSRLPNNLPGLVKCAFPLNLENRILESWLHHANLVPIPSAARKPKAVPLTHQNDPIRRQMILRLKPKHFDMEKFVRDKRQISNIQNYQWVKAFIEFGIRESYSIPVFSGLGEYWSLAAMRFEEDPPLRVFSDDEIGQLHWLALNLAEFSISHLNWREPGIEKPNHPLYPRELECLCWASRGKTTIETAEILGLKTETVRKYIKLANAKLAARNTTHAVSIAYQLGYLTPQSDS